MTTISAISPINHRKWDYFKNLASIVCSRESTYRTALDIAGFDIPAMGADAFRGVKRFLETTFETMVGAITIFIAPHLTTFTAHCLSKLILPKQLQKNAMQYLKFNMVELRKTEDFKQSIERIRSEEIQDKNLVAELYKRIGKNEKANFYTNQAKEIENFCKNFKATEEERKFAYKLKKATLIGESFLEGIWWGGSGLFVRAFRKYILRADRFTGTINYINDAESEELGEGNELTPFQKTTGITAMFLAPVLNFFMLQKLEDEKVVEKSTFLQRCINQFDTTHGIYPKLGLLFSVTIIPKYFSVLTTSQGWFERIERLFRLVSVVPSWWLGHRITNGLLALNADKQLCKKYNVDRGILVEPKYINNEGKDSLFQNIEKRFPEPAKIHHVLKTTENNPILQKEAEDSHAKCLYKGFALHSALVWLMMMLVNYSTKIRASNALNK